MLRAFIKSLMLLHSTTNAWQLAFGISFGMVLGLTPLLGLHNVLTLFLLLILRVNLSFALIAFGVFSAIAYLLDPLFHQCGWTLLNAENLRGLWSDFYNDPLWRWARFNNTVLLGSVVCSVLLFFPLAGVSYFAINAYRRHWQEKVEKWKVVQALKASRWFSAANELAG